MIGVSLWLPSIPDLNPFDYAIMGRFRIQKKCNFAFRYSFAIEEKWNKSLKDFFLKHANCFECVLIL